MTKSQQTLPFSIVAALGLTMMLGPFSLDTYLPAFPSIAKSLGVSTHDMGLSVSVYVFGLALGQLIGGPLSDRFGRKPLLMTGLAIFTVACVALSTATTLPAFLALRALQALGAGWVLVSVPALVRDRTHGQEAAKLFSMIGLIMIVAPGIAPSIGSALLRAGSWHLIFLFIAAYAVLLVPLLMSTVFRGAPKHAYDHDGVGAIARYIQVLKKREAFPFILWQVGCYSAMMLFITHASFIYQEHFGQTPEAFALLFGANIAAVFVINLTNRFLLNRLPSIRLLQGATAFQAVGAVLLVASTQLNWGLPLFVVAMMITVGCMGAISPNNQACFMESFPKNGGSAAALLGAAQFGIAGGVSALSSLLPEAVDVLMLGMAGSCAVSFAVMIWSLGRPMMQMQPAFAE